MTQKIIELVEKTTMKEDVPEFEIGDTVDVHCLILEGEKSRSWPREHRGEKTVEKEEQEACR